MKNETETSLNNRPFGELTKEERASLTDEEWLKVPPEEKKSCHDCRYLETALSLWCGNDEAKKWRGTAIPGGCLCPFWESQPPRKTLKVRIFNFLQN